MGINLPGNPYHIAISPNPTRVTPPFLKQFILRSAKVLARWVSFCSRTNITQKLPASLAIRIAQVGMGAHLLHPEHLVSPPF